MQLQRYFRKLSRVWESYCISKSMTDRSAVQKGLKAIKKSKRKKARRILESLQRRNPHDFKITHSLALLNYWETLSADNPKTIDPVIIMKTIANWGMLLNSDLFWKSWCNEREPYYHNGNIAKEQINELRSDLKTHLNKIISKDYAIDILLENKTAELFKRLSQWGRSKGLASMVLTVGPLMLKELNLFKKTRGLISLALKVDPGNYDCRLLDLYLSPVGKITLLLKVERVEDSLAELGKVNGKIRKKWLSNAFMEIYTEACTKWANQAQNVVDSIGRMEKAVKILDDGKIKYELSTRYFRHGVEIANTKSDWDTAINHLRRSLELFKSSDAEMNLALCLNQRAIEKSDKLVKRLQKMAQEPPYANEPDPVNTYEWPQKLGNVFSYNPDPALRKKLLYMLHPNLLKRCHYCREPIDGQYIIKNMGDKTYNMCMKCWNEEQKERTNIMAEFETNCLRDLQEAHNLASENEFIKRNLQDIKGLVSQIRKSIQAGVR